MIRHQAIRINVKGLFRFLVLEQAQKLEMVIVRLEYPLAIIATRDRVVKPTGYFDSRLPCHGGPRIFRRLAKCQYFKPDPAFLFCRENAARDRQGVDQTVGEGRRLARRRSPGAQGPCRRPVDAPPDQPPAANRLRKKKPSARNEPPRPGVPPLGATRGSLYLSKNSNALPGGYTLYMRCKLLRKSQDVILQFELQTFKLASSTRIKGRLILQFHRPLMQRKGS